jgi:hypothetical protein
MLRTIREAGRSRFGAALVVAIGVVLSAGAASASVIAGPVLNTNDSGWVDSGLGFTAIVNSTLTSFTFQNQGLADTVVLVDPLGNILDQVATAAGVFSNTVSVNWSLTAGSNYYLLQTTQNNGVFTDWGLAAPFNADIALTDTGDWSNNGLASANFGIGGAAGSGTVDWGDFNNVTTNGSSVPEPASFILVLPFAAAVLLRASRKRFVSND